MKYDVPEMVLTLAFVTIKLKKYVSLEGLYAWLRSQQDIYRYHSS